MLPAGTAPQVFAAAKDPMQLVAEAKAKISEVTPQQVKADMDAGKAVILLDVRDAAEFDAGHLPKAMNISRGLLEFKIGGMIADKNANIVLYCRTDARSALATAVLQEMGYSNVKNMQGAFKAWGEAGILFTTGMANSRWLHLRKKSKNVSQTRHKKRLLVSIPGAFFIRK